MLPFYPVYGLSQMGIPFLLYAFLCLYRKKHLTCAYVVIGLYGLTVSLVCTGYVVLGFWLLAILIQRFRREKVKQLSIGFLELLFLYVVSNAGLFAEVILGQEGYVSHREEMVNSSMPFFRAVFDIFVNGHYHAIACHMRLILPIVFFLALYGIRYKKLGEDARKRYRIAAWGMAECESV